MLREQLRYLDTERRQLLARARAIEDWMCYLQKQLAKESQVVDETPCTINIA